MIVRTLQEANEIKVFKRAISHVLVNSDDDVGHSLIDVKICAGKETTIEKEYSDSFKTHAYYNIRGEGMGVIDGDKFKINPGTLIACATQKCVVLTAQTDMHVAAIFSSENAVPTTIVRNLEDLYHTERDVFWGNGRSRRLLIRQDGLGFALCITMGNSDTDSLIRYENHFESCYYISGTGEYKWECGNHPIKTGYDQGTVFIMNKHDTHHMRVADETVCLSIFSPPIEGNERHNFKNGNASSY